MSFTRLDLPGALEYYGRFHKEITSNSICGMMNSICGLKQSRKIFRIPEALNRSRFEIDGQLNTSDTRRMNMVIVCYSYISYIIYIIYIVHVTRTQQLTYIAQNNLEIWLRLQS